MRILIIVPPERSDFYNYLAKVENVEWILLWHEQEGELKLSPDETPIKFAEIIYWTQFSTPHQLLRKVFPDKIIFFEIIDLRQIALIIAASANKTPTFYLGHAAVGDKKTSISRWKEVTFKGHKLPYLINRFRNSFFNILRSKFFYYSVVRGFKSFSSYIKYFLLPFKMLRRAPNEVMAYNKFRERVPQKSIVFNKIIYDEYKLYTGVSSQDVVITGVPFFDNYYGTKNTVKDHVVYIDHPYLEYHILGWTAEHHQKIAEVLFNFAEKNKIPFYIKLHPHSNLGLWNSYSYNKEYIKVIQAGEFTNIFLESKLILGFSSSLVTGFLCAKKNVVLLGWHPKPYIFGVDFSKTGICHLSFSPDDLGNKYSYWVNHNLTLENNDLYMNFLRSFNYPFDGKAQKRIIEAINEL